MPKTTEEEKAILNEDRRVVDADGPGRPAWMLNGLKVDDLKDPALRKLNAREVKFVEAYVCGDERSVNNVYRSAIVAGFPHITALNHAHKWVVDPKLRRANGYSDAQERPYIFEAVQRRRAEIAERAFLSDVQIINEIRKVAMFNYGTVMKVTSAGDPYLDLSEMSGDDLAAIAETTMEDYLDARGEDKRQVRRIRVKAHDKIAALTLLTKVFGMQRSEKVVHYDGGRVPGGEGGSTHDLAKLTEDELEAYLQLVRKMEGRETEDDRLYPVVSKNKSIEGFVVRELVKEGMNMNGDPETEGVEGGPEPTQVPPITHPETEADDSAGIREEQKKGEEEDGGEEDDEEDGEEAPPAA
jgi:hypothetical protein